MHFKQGEIVVYGHRDSNHVTDVLSKVEKHVSRMKDTKLPNQDLNKYQSVMCDRLIKKSQCYRNESLEYGQQERDRHRRAWFGVVGTGIKKLFGNPDENDFLKSKRRIENLEARYNKRTKTIDQIVRAEMKAEEMTLKKIRKIQKMMEAMHRMKSC